MATQHGATFMVGIPTTSAARKSAEWTNALFAIDWPLGSSHIYHFVENAPIAEAREQLVDLALVSNAKYLLFLGDDVLLPRRFVVTALERMGRRALDEHGVMQPISMVTGVYWTKSRRPMPYLWRGFQEGPFLDWIAGDFVHVDWSGLDAILIPVAMLREMRRRLRADGADTRLFRTDWEWGGGARPAAAPTEDLYFFTLARQMGFHVWADTDLQCAHEDRNTGERFGIYEGAPQLGVLPQMDLPPGTYRVADVGAGLESPNFGEDAEVTRFDMDEKVRPDVVCDITRLPVKHHGQYDIVHSRHVLEHFPRAESAQVLEHWCLLLKPGGRVIVRVPNIARAVMDIAYWKDRTPEQVARAWDEIYGMQRHPLDYHYQGFTPDRLRALMEGIRGMSDISITLEDGGRNLLGTAIYVKPYDPPLSEMWRSVKIMESGKPPATDPEVVSIE